MTLSPERIALGKQRVGASEIGALILDEEGAPVHPYLTPLSLFERKMGLDDPKVKRHLDWGNALEQPMIRDFAEHNGFAQRGPAGLVMTSSRFKALLATPDDILEKESLVYPCDAKNVQLLNPHLREWGEPGSDEAPLLYIAQVAIQIEIATETMQNVPVAPRGFLVASLGGAPPEAWSFTRDAELVGQMDELAAKFVRDCLIPQRPPDKWWNDPAASEYVKRRYRDAAHVTLPADPESQALGAEVARLRSEKNRLVKELKAAQSRLCDRIGNAVAIEGIARWTPVKELKATVTDWEAMCREIARDLVPKTEWERLPAIREKHTTERVKRKGYRRLHVNGAPKEEEEES